MKKPDEPGAARPSGDALPALRSFLEFQRNLLFVAAVALLLLALATDGPEIAWFRDLVNVQDPRGGVWMLRTLAAVLAIGGAILFALGWRMRDPRTHPVLSLLLERPESVVWVGVMGGVEQRLNGTAVSRSRMLLLYTDAGVAQSLEVGETRLTEILDELERQLPHATFGFTPERLERWREDPASLRLTPDTGTPYRATPQDRDRIRPKLGAAPVGAIVLLALLGVRIALAADFHCTPGGSPASHGNP